MAWIPDWGVQIDAIARVQPIDTLVHVGVSDEDALDTLICAKARRVVLVEPDSDRAAQLVRRTADQDHVEVIAAALGQACGEAPFLRLSLPEFSDIHIPEDLFALYPGLRIEARIETAVLDVPALLQTARIAPLKAESAHLLILDSPVAAARHAALFLDASVQDSFDRILLQTSRDGMGEGPATALLKRFAETGFLTEDVAPLDGDVVRARLIYPARLRKAEATAAKVPDMQACLDELQKKNATLSEAEDSTRRDLRLALRMQAMLERDIAELRDQFGALRDAKVAQDALLARMMSPLSRALEAVRKKKTPTSPTKRRTS